MLSRKFKPPCHQFYLSRNYCVNKDNWPSIYTNKIKNLYVNRLSEIIYNKRNNIFVAIFFLQKYKLIQHSKCDFCDFSNEDINYLNFDCDNVKRGWHNLNIVLNIIVKWWNVVIDFLLKQIKKVLFYNTFIFLFRFLYINKFKMGCGM